MNTPNTLTLAQLDTVTGGAGLKMPLSGNVTQEILGWGSTKNVKNVFTKVINEAPKMTNSVVEFMRTHPFERRQAGLNRPLHR